jgi:curved DNA-binding protein CbpA
MIKKIRDLDYYEILNVRVNASPRDIENAYLLALATYHQEGLASYGVFMDEERSVILNSIEEAFRTLRDPEKRKAYDAQVRDRLPEIPQKAAFRKSTTPLMIEDAAGESGFWEKIRSAVAPDRRRKARSDPGRDGDRKDWLSRADDSYYYGEFLKKVRERQGLSLEDIAEKCGVDPFKLRSLEEEISGPPQNGKKTLDLLRCYAKCLGLDTDNGKDSPPLPRFR